MPTPRQNLGRWGEALAAEYLQKRGYTILERNARTPYGEIDLVAQQTLPALSPTDPAGGLLTVFVEVKTRRTSTYGMPEASVTPRKQAHMLASAQAYLQAHPELPGNWRIDVLAIQRIHPNQAPVILHFENALNGI